MIIMKYIPIILIATITLAACNHNKVAQEQLHRIDSLISAENTESAKSQLMKIDSGRLNDYEQALFHLQNIIIKYKQYDHIVDTACLDQCIETFRRHGDKRNVCRSYAFKASILYEQQKYTTAIRNVKIAEEIMEDIDDGDTQMRIYSMLAHMNAKSANYNTSLEYSNKLLRLAYRNNCKRWVAYALNEKGVVYDHLGRKDSSMYYEQEVIPYLNFLPKVERAHVMNNIALSFSYRKQYDSAEYYLNQSLRTHPMPHVCGNLAVLKANRDGRDGIDSLFKESFKTEIADVKIYLMTKYAEWLQKQERYEEATALGLEAKYLRDSLSNIQDTERMKEIQEDYDLLSQTYKHRKKEGLMLVLVAGLLIVSLVLYTCYRKKTVDNRNRMSQMKKRIAEYEVALEKLKAGGKEQELVAKELRRRMDDVKKGMKEILIRGKQKFTSLMEEGNTTQHWHKRDYLDAIEYYFMKKPQVMEVIHNNYKHLSATQTLYLLLLDHGLSEDSAAQALNMSNGAMRTMKSRIKKKQDDENVK